MNEVFIIGKIEELEFKFMYNSKYISICTIKIRLENKCIIEAYGYNEIADKILQELKIGNVIFINGELRNGKVEIKRYNKFLIFFQREFHLSHIVLLRFK